MAAGLGFKTFTTGEVLTAADVNGYLMQGILVFATEAARNSAITSPQEGQFAFTKDTNSLWYYTGSAWVASGATGDIEGVTAGTGISGGGTSGTVTITNSMATAIDAKGDLVPGTGADTFSRLAVGANGTVLTADSAEATGLKWAAPSSGALTLISTTSFSAVATQSFNSVFSATYENYVIYFRFHSSSNNPTFFRFRAAGTDSSSANYNGAVRSLSSGAAMATEWAGSGSTSFTIGNLPTTSATTPHYISMTIYNPFSATAYKAQTHDWTQGDGGKGGYGWGTNTLSTSFDGFSIFNGSGGGATLTGTVSIYGVSK